MTAPAAIDRAVNGESFLAHVKQVLAPEKIVVMDEQNSLTALPLRSGGGVDQSQSAAYPPDDNLFAR